MYTTQPLEGFNTFEQGAGQLNVAGAVALAKIIRGDLPGLLKPTFGSNFLTQSAPAPQTTISGFTFGTGSQTHHDHVQGPDCEVSG
jgi:hypothetical protein